MEGRGIRPAILLAAAYLLASAAVAAPRGARIACDRPVFDFGLISSTSVVSHVFVVRNDGDTELHTPVVRGTCSCTTGSISRTSIPPGGTAEVTAVFRPEGRTGPQRRNVIVFASDTNLTLTLAGEVQRDISVTPAVLSAGRIRPDRPAVLEAVLENHTTNAVRVTSASASDTNLAVSVTEVVAGRRYAIRVATLPPLACGSRSAIVHVFTDSPKDRVVDIPFGAEVLGPLVVAPPQFILPESSGPASRFVIVTRGSNTNAFRILGVETPDPAITTQQLPAGADGFRIMVNNIVARRELDGKAIRITTDCAEQPEILVPIAVRPAPGRP